MSKTLFTTDFEFRASRKMLYPYIFSPGGLAQWFADDVTIDEDKNYNFIWDSEDHWAKMVGHRTNNYVKFEFFPENEEDKADPAHFELRLELNELTQTTFLKIIDYSEMDDKEELQDLWAGLVHNLKETVGG